LLHEHRGVKLPYTEESLRTRNLKRLEVEEMRRALPGKATLTTERILEWADAHHSATGHWPTTQDRTISGVPGETWSTIDRALWQGARGLPGTTTLNRFLMHHRRGYAFELPADVTIEQLPAAADAYRAAHGCWPTAASPGPIPGIAGQTWVTIDGQLRLDRRNPAAGPLTLSRLLQLYRGTQKRRGLPDVTVDQILSWVDAHHAAHGRWPEVNDGRIAAAPGEHWRGINELLSRGGRGLPGGTSLARLVAERRGVRNRTSIPDLTVEQILAWADAHHAATGRWPTCKSGAVIGAPGENWNAITQALWYGRRGMPRRSSIPELLDAHRPAGRRRLTPERIRAWAEAHRAETGRWPATGSGQVTGVPGESWRKLDDALRKGYHGLKGGSSLARLLGARSTNTPSAPGLG
jgi:hypothetical protein